MTDDALGRAMFEVMGRTLPPEVNLPTPRFTVLCKTDGELLASVYATSQGFLLLRKSPRARRVNLATGVTTRYLATAAGMVDAAGDDLELHCQKCKQWRPIGNQKTLRTICDTPPRRGRHIV